MPHYLLLVPHVRTRVRTSPGPRICHSTRGAAGDPGRPSGGIGFTYSSSPGSPSREVGVKERVERLPANGSS